MTDQKLTALTETTTPVDTDLAYIVIDPAGVPTSRKMEWGNALAAHDIGVKVNRNNATQAIADSSWTAIAWTAEEWDTHGFHDNAVNNTRLTVPTGYGGKYDVHGLAAFAPAGAAKQLYIRIYANGATSLAVGQMISAAGINQNMQCHAEIELDAGEYIELQVFQDTGGNLNILGNTYDTQFSMRKVG